MNKNEADIITSLFQINNVKAKDNGKPSSHLLVFKDVGYHMVNWLVPISFCLVFISFFVYLCFYNHT